MSLKDTEGRHLYAVAVEKLNSRGQPICGKMFHINATSAAEAKIHYQSVVFPNRKTHRIVGAALAIGFFAEDKHGDKVSAT